MSSHDMSKRSQAKSPAPVTMDDKQQHTKGKQMTLDQYQTFVVESLQALKSVPTSIDTLIKSHDDLKTSLESANKEISDLNCILRDQAKEMNSLMSQVAHERQMTQVLRKTLVKQAMKMTQLETYSRRANLILEGLEEEEAENLLQTCITCLLDKFHTSMNPNDIDKVHRYGRSFNGRPRPVIIKFISHNARDKVLLSTRMFKQKPRDLYVNEDLPPEAKSMRSDIRAISIQARTSGAKTVKLMGDRVLIDGKMYTHANLHSLPLKYSLEAARTIKANNETIAFYSKYAYMSNFYPAEFLIDGKLYNCSEQYYQCQKLKHAGRDDLITEMMAEENPLSQKKMGDSLNLSKDGTWQNRKESVMREALKHKFLQNPKLMKKLKETGNKTLVEATKDAYWGAGCTLNSDKLRNNTWSGQNITGRLLMNLRDN